MKIKSYSNENCYSKAVEALWQNLDFNVVNTCWTEIAPVQQVVLSSSRHWLNGNKHKQKLAESRRQPISAWDSSVFNHSSNANLVPVLTRSMSSPWSGARLQNKETGREVSLSSPHEDTSVTLTTYRKWTLKTME